MGNSDSTLSKEQSPIENTKFLRVYNEVETENLVRHTQLSLLKKIILNFINMWMNSN